MFIFVALPRTISMLNDSIDGRILMLLDLKANVFFWFTKCMCIYLCVRMCV